MSLGDIVRERLAVADLAEGPRAVVRSALDSIGEDGVVDASLPSGVFLTSLSVEGFRGIGQKVTVPLRPGAGLTVITGRNGSGKSSLAESVELLLTGDNARWADKKSSDLRKGWKNLHHKGDTKIEVELTAAGMAMIGLSRHWTGDSLEVGGSMVKRPGKDPVPIESLGWSQALKTYRPFLSYGELGGLLEDGPSRLHDAIANILGLEEFTAIKDVLSAKKTALNAQSRASKAAWAVLEAELKASEDPRAAAVAAVTGKRGWKEAQVEAVLVDDGAGDEGVAGWCRSVMAIAPLPTGAVADAVATARDASAAVAALHGSDAATALATATLLEQAIALHRSVHLSDCPVCATESVIDDAWLGRAETDVARLHAEASAARDAAQRSGVAERGLRQSFPATPAVLGQPPEGLDEPVRMVAYEVQAAWSVASQSFQSLELDALLVEAGSVVAGLNGQLDALKDSVAAVLEAADSEWTPLARKVRAWCVQASEMGDVDGELKDVTAAESWVVGLSNEFRDERLAPIRASVEEVWNDLRCDSNVSLANFELGGKGTRRRVDLSLTVDDTPAPTLGVLSQGEMHALALSMFLPRAALDESPFRFLVIDDPVQAMDPSKVDGLARQLAKVAQTRQVIVLTHDDRLPEAVRRLDIDARVLEVVRGPKSGVRVDASMDPTERRFKAARDLAKDRKLPAAIATQVIAAQCRQALEAECVDLIQIRMIRAGTPMAQVDEKLDEATTLNDLLSLLVLNDPHRADEAKMVIGDRMKGARQVIGAVQAGSHGDPIAFEPDKLISETRALVKTLRAIESS